MRYLFLLLFISCAGKVESYCSINNCNPTAPKCNNLGHRLGGDMRHIADNRLSSIAKASRFEEHDCFRFWEFDVRSAKDKLIVYHDTKYNGKLVTELKSKELPEHDVPRDILDSLYRLPNKKRVSIDVKHILPIHVDEFISLAHEFKDKGLDLSMRIHCSRKNEQIVRRIKDEGFYVKLYRCE